MKVSDVLIANRILLLASGRQKMEAVFVSFQDAGLRPLYIACALLQKVFPSLTKIVGTLGPNSHSVQVIEECLTAGMSGLTTVSFQVTRYSATGQS